MPSICDTRGANLVTLLNANMSYLFVVCSRFCRALPNLGTNGIQIARSDGLKYLGVNFMTILFFIVSVLSLSLFLSLF